MTAGIKMTLTDSKKKPAYTAIKNNYSTCLFYPFFNSQYTQIHNFEAHNITFDVHDSVKGHALNTFIYTNSCRFKPVS